MKPTILVIESSEFQARLISDVLTQQLSLPTYVVHSLDALEQGFKDLAGQEVIAISNLQLPDAAEGEAVDYCLDEGIPTIVLSSTFEPELRQALLQKQVVDYILKSSNSLDQIIHLVDRLVKNASVTVLIVDDSRLFRKEQSRLLTLQRFQVIEASNGVEALEALAQHPEIQLVLTDLEMPLLDGLELTESIRKSHSKQQIAIIGLSAYGDNHTSAMFIKNGANDFLRKPFLQEEFNCRVQQNIELLEYIKQLKKAAHCDYLTDLYNRRYFFDQTAKSFTQAGSEAGVAKFDLDHFKLVNDTYGHEAGDVVLVHFANLLKTHLSSVGLVARLGGEEFSIYFELSQLDQARVAIEQLRQATEAAPVRYGDIDIKITVSIGLHYGKGESVDQLLAEADKNLYLAKESGRNKVVG